MRNNCLSLMLGFPIGICLWFAFASGAYGQTAKDALMAYNNGTIQIWGKGDYAKALPELEKALRMYRQLQGEESVDAAKCLDWLAHAHEGLGQYAKAERLLQRSIEIHEAKLGKYHERVANGLNNLAHLYRRMGQYGKAEPLLQRKLAIHEADPSDHLLVIETLRVQADLYRDMRQFAKAELLLQRSLRIGEIRFSMEDNEVGITLTNLASLYRKMGQYAKAEPLLQRTLQIQEKNYGKDNIFVASSLADLAGLYHEMGEYTKAEANFVRAIEIYQTKLGEVDRIVRFNSGPKKDSVIIVQAQFDKDSLESAIALGNLGIVYHDMGQYAKAEPLLQRKLAIYEAKFGENHPLVATSLSTLACNSVLQKEYTRAVNQVHRARQGITRYFAQQLPTLSEKEQLSMLQANFDKAFHLALSLGWTAPKVAGTASAEWLLNGKALVHQGLAEQHLLARDTKDPKAQKSAEDLKRTRSRLAFLINQLPTPGKEREHQQDMQALRSREQQLSETLARAVGRPYRTNPWVTLADLRGKLGPRTVFVDIARFSVFDFATNKSQAPRYVAWITPPQDKGEVQLIDLGETEPIDQLVAAMRRSLLESARSVTEVGEVGASDTVQKPLKELSTKVLHPLLPALQKYEEWIVCPDGALWLTPWNALLLTDGKFAIEKYLIRHAVSGRDLVLELPTTQAESAYIVADPDFDLSPSKVIAAASGLRGIGGNGLIGQRLQGAIGTWNVSFEFLDNEVVIRDEDGSGAIAGKGTWKQQGNALTIQTRIARYEATIEPGGITGRRTVRNDDGATSRDTFRMDSPRGSDEDTRSAGSALGTLPRVPRLPGTAMEAEAVRPRIQQWLGQEPKVFVDDKASEATVKAVKNPRVLTLATHGYFLPTQEVEGKDRPGLESGSAKRSAALFDKQGQAIENPLLRCGLLLAGCNERATAKLGEDDGILTGLEIVGMNLIGCELVVLSACETGLGDVRNGEGVAGLRQAFQLAGAKSVLASLWQVPDRETALLMNTFYSELAKGRSQAEALRHAQLQRIASRRQQFGAAHPFFWSAFTLTSRGKD